MTLGQKYLTAFIIIVKTLANVALAVVILLVASWVSGFVYTAIFDPTLVGEVALENRSNALLDATFSWIGVAVTSIVLWVRGRMAYDELVYPSRSGRGGVDW